MIIPKKQMQKIAEEVGVTIQRNVNIMDETGRIIASTDKSRIGMSHAGAEELLEKHLDEVIIETGEKGTRCGINLPLTIENRTIGVVGITGPVSEVRILGGVIKKMTEILILDKYKNSQKQALEELKRGFMIDLLFGEDENKIEVGGEMLRINIKHPRIMSVLEIEADGTDEEKNQELMEHIISKIKKEVERDEQQLGVRLGEKIVILHNSNSMEDAARLLSDLVKTVKQGVCRIYGGVGRAWADKAGLQRSYREAELACSMVKAQKEEGVRIYSGTDLPLLLINIPYKKREAFVNEVFHNCDENQKREMIQCLKSYIANNGSITKVAEELFVHKNTLQYRLTKMKSLTGYDPRILGEAIPLAVAVYLEEFM